VTRSKNRQANVIAALTAALGIAAWVTEEDWLLGLTIVGIGLGGVWYGLAIGPTGHEPGVVGAGLSKLPRQAGRIGWIVIGLAIAIFGVVVIFVA
jgi:hypothetical protein